MFPDIVVFLFYAIKAGVNLKFCKITLTFVFIAIWILRYLIFIC